MNETIPTGERREVVKLDCGGVVHVRRIRRSLKNDIARVAGLSFDVASSQAFGELIIRAAVVGAENLSDCETNASVPFKTERHGVLGEIATRTVYDALTDDDVVRIFKAAGGSLSGASLTEAQQGN